MTYKVLIYRNGEFYKEIHLKPRPGDLHIYKWEDVEMGSYSFEIVTEEGEVLGVTYNHTAPFANMFDAYVERSKKPKPITGFQPGIDVLVKYNSVENSFSLIKTKFTRTKISLSDLGLEKANKIEVAAGFNGWQPDEEPIRQTDDGNYEMVLSLSEGYYEYKLYIDGRWFPEVGNHRLVIGENGALFPLGDIGTGKFVYEPIDKNSTLKAIVHDYMSLQYLNKISDREFEFTIRTQMNDVERAFINIVLHEEDNYETVYELERFRDYTNGFDYFKRIIMFDEEIEEIFYLFTMEDSGVKAYFNGEDFSFKKQKKKKVNFKKDNIQIFSIPDWSKEAIWYNIFPDRFYNGNHYNDPIFNEFGAEKFKINKLHESKFIEEYKWKKDSQVLGKFEINKWTSDFGDRTDWEEVGEIGISYSLKYARMYGGDLQGIKEKIPYLKELGITAVWLNPVFLSYQNHKYGANDFRHVSPDFGTIRTSGEKHGVEISSQNEHGNKSYVEVLGIDAVDNSEYKLLEINLKGENKGKNGYGETHDPSTWVWTESDLIMVDVIKELHKNGIRVIFDGVFNHSSDRHWTFNMVLAEGSESKYKEWYKFSDFTHHVKIEDYHSDQEAYEILIENKKNVKYNGWAGFDTLPEFNTFNQEYKDYIFNITRKWMIGPDAIESEDWMSDDGIDGWRLDVPNCLENQGFWNEWREVVKSCKKDSYITAELWGNAAGDINKGNKFDTVMNYEWLKTTIGYFINQSSEGGRRYKLKASDFFNELREKRTWYPYQSLQSSQNLNGSHDTDRLYSRIINDRAGRDLEEGKQLEQRYNSIRPDLASVYHPNTTIDWKNIQIKPKDILKLISIFQMTYIGAPMLYYGDEVGMWGATDPYCRKPMLWEEFTYDEERNPSYVNQGEVYDQKADKDLFQWYQKLIKIRKENSVLVYGRFKEILNDDEKDIIVYERYDDNNSVIVVINNSFYEYNNYEIQIENADTKYFELIYGNMVRTKKNGKMNLNLKPKRGMILKNWKD